MDLTGTVTLHWRSHQSGFHELRAIVELENGDWLVSETSDPTSSQWHILELVLSDTRWRQLNIFTVNEGSFVSEVSLDRVRSVGFTDLRTADRCAENLETLVNALRHDLDKPELPVLVSTYRQKSMPDDLKDMNSNDFRYESDNPRPGALKVMQAQTNVANTILNSAP